MDISSHLCLSLWQREWCIGLHPLTGSVLRRWFPSILNSKHWGKKAEPQPGLGLLVVIHAFSEAHGFCKDNKIFFLCGLWLPMVAVKG